MTTNGAVQVLIVDDEPLARKRIRTLLQAERGMDVVGECANGKEAVDAIRKQRPDLLFLDVQMPELDGFGVLAAVGAERVPAVVFVTAYDQYALRAFEVHALDYLLKPFDQERFQVALNQAKRQLERQSTGELSQRLSALLAQLGGGRAERLLVKTEGRVFFLKVEEIDWIEAAGNYVRVHVGNDSHLLRETMHAMEAKLDPNQFLRMHRSTIVNVDRIKELQPWFNGEYVVILRDGTQLRLSRGYRDRFDRFLGA